MKYFIFFIVFLFFELVILSFTPEDKLIEIVKSEKQSATKWFGNEKTASMVQEANLWFKTLFVDGGLRDSSVNYFIRHKGKNNGEMNELGNAKFFLSLSNGMKKIWMIVESGMLRLQIMMVCLILSLTFLVPAVVDGTCRREIKKSSDRNVSINLYTISLKVFAACLVFPIVLLFWPFSISPTYMVVWTLVLALSIWIATSNLQLQV